MPIRNATIVYVEENAFVGIGARCNIEVVRKDVFRRRIGKVHGLVVFAPTDTITYLHFLHHAM